MDGKMPMLTIDAGMSAGSLQAPPLRAGLVWATGLAPVSRREAPSPWLASLLAEVRAAGEAWLPPGRKAAVRDMLRHGKYKPAGRAKPSSEYLLAAALEGEGPLGGFPLVNGPVDANNAVSLASGYPASIFDLSKSGPQLLLRRGLPGESYVFNAGGQVIELEDLMVLCRLRPDGSWEPCGNPVKDAMATKVFEGCEGIVAVVFGPRAEPPFLLEEAVGRFEALLREDCGAERTGRAIVGG